MDERFVNLVSASKGITVDDKFWSPRLAIYRNVTIWDTLEKLEQDGVLENFQRVIMGEGKHQGFPWHDGLLFEAIRGASDFLRIERDDRLEMRIDGYADLITRAQEAAGGGYLSSYTILERPHQRYGENGGNLQWQHDLYNCGCMIEAGVRYYRATGKSVLLACSVRCANELATLIGPPPRKWYVPAHPLPEYALLELYDLAMEEKDLYRTVNEPINPDAYRDLVRFWVRGRGHHIHRTNLPQYLGEYAQDHAPINEQFQAVGHAVRAMLYYTGVTRLALVDQDEALLGDSLRLWKNVTLRKLHINGGVGATHFEEKFGIDYDLPNDAYLETCASVGLIFWAKALHDATGIGRYYDIIERALYNIMLSSITLQGDAYFYRNPLISNGDDHHWAWHNCPCCPPMFLKLFGAFDQYLYSMNNNTGYVNLYVSGEASLPLVEGEMHLSVDTEYPLNGKVNLLIDRCGRDASISLRIPEWSDSYTLHKNGKKEYHLVENGYITLSVLSGDLISLDLRMTVMRMQAHPYVVQDRGYVAIQRGPLVYCLEGVDNKGVVDIEIPQSPVWREDWQPDLLLGVMQLHSKDVNGREFKAIPLYSWDNRMAGKMQVWLRQQGVSNSWSTDGWKDQLYRPYRT